MQLNSRLAKGCMQGKDRSTHPWVLLLTPRHPSESLLAAGRCAEMLPVRPMKAVLISSGLCSSPVLGRAGEKPKGEVFSPEAAGTVPQPATGSTERNGSTTPGLQAPQPWQELAWRCARRHLTEVDFSVWAGALLTSHAGASQSYLSPRLGFGR